MDPQIPTSEEKQAGSADAQAKAEEILQRELRRRSRRGFLYAGVAAAAGLGGWEWLRTRAGGDGVPWPLRRGLEIDERLSRRYFRETRLAREFPRDAAEDMKVNGDIGVDDDDFDPAQWKLTADGLAGHDGPISLGLDEIRALARFEMTTEFKCIEGWSKVVHWAGARMADFVAKYPPRNPGDGYVALETPDAAYYVGIDMTSAMHPQTMLCYEMNGAPLEVDHGAPLRLVIPLKYGIKNLKRIGRLRFTDARPKDYWAERGYDWYAGF